MTQPSERAKKVAAEWLAEQAENQRFIGDFRPSHIPGLAQRIQAAIDQAVADKESFYKSQINAAMAVEQKDCLKALNALAGKVCTPQEGFGYNTSWAIGELCKHIEGESGRLDQAVRDEREACLELAKTTPFRCHAESDKDFHSGCIQTRERIVDAVRARSEEKGETK